MGSRLALMFIMGLLIASPIVATAESFDFFYLVLMWPGAYCVQSRCCLPKTGKPANDFYLRGLWTYDATSGNAVTKCNNNNSNFYINDLESVKGSLYLYWPNVKCPSNDGKSSWRSTWKTYGVCSNLVQIDYFKAALTLRAKIDVLSILTTKGIFPDYNLYKVSDIKKAIAEEIGSTPTIRCSKGPFDKFQLYEVYICIAKDGSTIIDCPVDAKFTCSDEILFHPYRDWMLNSTASLAASYENPIAMKVEDVYR